MPYRFLPEPPDNPPFLDGRSQERIEASVFWPSCRSAGGQNRARVAQVSNEFGSLPLSREPPRPLGSDVESWGFYASLRFFCLFLSSVRFRSDRAGSMVPAENVSVALKMFQSSFSSVFNCLTDVRL
ncbi:hypothetical protein FQA47_015264 [Oryzias melastigma]|uniref:Uncharacterized protein n=1 Tax=Oryzias melastigma TaxID=30732 RepID=A0A834CX93_ORYME|nr:hypothetical protein FQA47_015264 [Oryzias melastigma]